MNKKHCVEESKNELLLKKEAEVIILKKQAMFGGLVYGKIIETEKQIEKLKAEINSR